MAKKKDNEDGKPASLQSASCGGKPARVKLLKNHTHAGKDYEAGEIIEVRTDQVKWLEEAGVAVSLIANKPASLQAGKKEE